MTLTATRVIQNIPAEKRPKISEWVYRQNSLGSAPFIRHEQLAALGDGPPLSFTERARRLLLYLSVASPLPQTRLSFRALNIEAMLQTYSASWVEQVVQYLKTRGWVNIMPPNDVALTAEGLIQAEEWGATQASSKQGFVAMWFDESMAKAWEDGLEPAIRAAGYEAMRIDRKEHANKICDEIIAEIRRSRFLVADYTGQRGGVYYEAGFAAGLGIPVILTCQKGDLKNLHFDIRQYNCIDWDEPANLAQRLQARIESVIGDGPGK